MGRIGAKSTHVATNYVWGHNQRTIQFARGYSDNRLGGLRSNSNSQHDLAPVENAGRGRRRHPWVVLRVEC